MASLQIADRVLITVNILAFEQHLMSTFVYGVSSLTPPVTQAQAFAVLHTKVTGVGGLITTYRNVLCPEFLVSSVWYQVISPSRYAKYEFTSGLGLGTFAAGAASSANQAAVILRRGDGASRKQISTLHVPIGQDSDCQANGGIGGGIETPLDTLASQLKDSITTATTVIQFDPVINNGPNATDFTPITITSVKPWVRVMRRRTVGLGI